MLAGGPTGLYGHVEQNRRRSLLLFAGFIVAIEVMAFVILVMPTLMLDWPHCPLVSPRGYFTRYVLPVALVGLLVYAVKYWWFVGAVQKAVGFRYVDDGDEPRLCRILEPLCIAAGIRLPHAAVIDSPALNAFACGVRADRMVVVATRGLIDGLDDDELAAVLAHEVIHIRNRDTLLLASANVFMATLTMARGGKQVAFDRWRQLWPLVLLPTLLPLYLVATFLTQVSLRIGACSRAAIGSAREFIADAEAVRLTKNPAALVSALRKIEGHSRIDTVAPAQEAMMIDGPVEGPLATHPTVTERIAALARTTGSMIFEGGIRLDTRAPALAVAAKTLAFGQRDDQLVRIAALAQAPPRAGLWNIFRKTRDPERNLLGFNRRGARNLAITLLLAGMLHQTAILIFIDAIRNPPPLTPELAELKATLKACDRDALRFRQYNPKCDDKNIERLAVKASTVH